MGNILVLGVGPLPVEASDKLHAPGLRTWQLAEVLARANHFVTIGTIEFGDFDEKGRGSTILSQREELGSRISRINLKYHPESTVQALTTLHVASRFSCVVSTTDIMNALSAELDVRVPKWMDYNGDPFAEKQLQAAVHRHDGSLPRQWELYLKGLYSGDKFSVCSEPQRCSMIGQLAFAGRLTGMNDGFEFIHVMPNSSRAVAGRTSNRSFQIKGHKIPTTSTLLLWTGGFNTWSDPITLFRGVASAMEANPGIYLALTGGAIEGHDTKSFEQFEQLVLNSPLKERFLFLGWRPIEEVISLFQQADIAVLAEKNCVEGELGARTRIMEWLQFALPVVASPVCEMSRALADNDLIYAYPAENPSALAATILKAAREPDLARSKAKQAQAWFDANLSEDKVFQSLIQWASHPVFAPDRSAEGTPPSLLSNLLGYTDPTFLPAPPSQPKGGILRRLFSSKRGAK